MLSGFKIILVATTILCVHATPSPVRIETLSRTGDGKSSLCNLIVSILGETLGFSGFGEGKGASAHTHNPESRSVTTESGTLFEIIDTPGLMDPDGVKKDEVNIKNIVDYTKEKGYINAFLIVVNEQAPRFDRGMQDALKVFVDSYGLGFLDHVGIVFTRSFTKSPQEASRYVTEEILPIVQKLVGIPVSHIPHWQVDCHPDDLQQLRVPSDVIAELHQRNVDTVNALKQWAMSKSRFDVSQAVYGEFEAQKRLREAAEAQKQQEEELKREKERTAEAERRAREAAQLAATLAARGDGGSRSASLGDVLANTIFKETEELWKQGTKPIEKVARKWKRKIGL